MMKVITVKTSIARIVLLFVTGFVSLHPALGAKSLEILVNQKSRPRESAAADFARFWQDFQADPAQTAQQIPAKFDADGRQLPAAYDSVFSRSQITSREFVEFKVRGRSAQFGDEKSQRDLGKHNRFEAAPTRIDGLLDKDEFKEKKIDIIYNLTEIEKRNLTSATLPESPWSGSYWPIYQGGIAARYASPAFTSASATWKGLYDFVQNREKISEIFASQSERRIDDLSPAEKYDLIVAAPTTDALSGVTKHAWKDGVYYADAKGNIETWMGYCHGWAPAAFSVPRPINSVTMPAADGKTPVRFDATDIKALATYAWAQIDVPATYVGSRCDQKNPKRDSDNGRIIDAECFDINPAIWHISVVNQIGLANRSFVLDATFDYEVWNQPVLGYSYEYFNPQNGDTKKTWREAAVQRAAFASDKFKKYRSPLATQFVGVNMSLTYVSENSPQHTRDGESIRDQTRTVHYRYDLELDDNEQILGGEWYNASHPDFLWLPRYQAKPTLPEESHLSNGGSWHPGEPLPEFWKNIAARTAQGRGLPLPVIVEALAEAANTARPRRD